jgi:hypothetical protein
LSFANHGADKNIIDSSTSNNMSNIITNNLPPADDNITPDLPPADDNNKQHVDDSSKDIEEYEDTSLMLPLGSKRKGLAGGGGPAKKIKVAFLTRVAPTESTSASTTATASAGDQGDSTKSDNSGTNTPAPISGPPLNTSAPVGNSAPTSGNFGDLPMIAVYNPLTRQYLQFIRTHDSRINTRTHLLAYSPILLPNKVHYYSLSRVEL